MLVPQVLRAELALERGDPDEAYEEIEHGFVVASGTDDRTFRPEMCAVGVRALADQYEVARVRNRRVDVDKLRRLAEALSEQAAQLVATFAEGSQSPPRPHAWLALCRAELTRLHEPEPDRWRRGGGMVGHGYRAVLRRVLPVA